MFGEHRICVTAADGKTSRSFGQVDSAAIRCQLDDLGVRIGIAGKPSCGGSIQSQRPSVSRRDVDVVERKILRRIVDADLSECTFGHIKVVVHRHPQLGS
jgi:hypothetical protein